MARTFLVPDFYEQDTQNLVPRYDKCLNVGDAYVKK
jgi:hypothetical protein